MYLFGPNALKDPLALSMVSSFINQAYKRNMVDLTDEELEKVNRITGSKENNPNISKLDKNKNQNSSTSESINGENNRNSFEKDSLGV